MSVIDKIILNGTTYELGGSSGEGLSTDLKAAMDQIAQKVIYIDSSGQTYYNALHSALYPPANLSYISAVYTQSGTVYNTDTLDSLRTNLVVTAHYSNGTTSTVSAYTLSGTLTVGTSTITAAYGGKTATFNVTVTETPLEPIETTLYYQSVEEGGSTGLYARFYGNAVGYQSFWAKVKPNKNYKVTLTGKHFNRFRVQLNNTFDPENISTASNSSLYPLNQIYNPSPQPSNLATEQTFETTVNSGEYEWMTVQVRSAIKPDDTDAYALTCTVEEVSA